MARAIFIGSWILAGLALQPPVLAQDSDSLFEDWGDVYPFNNYYTPPPEAEPYPSPTPGTVPEGGQADTKLPPAGTPTPAAPVENFDPFAAPDDEYGYTGSYPSYGGSAAPGAPTSKPTPQPGDYTGTYKVGGQNYYYDQKTGQFKTSAVGKNNHEPPLITLAGAAEEVCAVWKHPLKGQRIFDSSFECNADLELAVSKALEGLQNEHDKFNSEFPVTALPLPVKVQEELDIKRPKLEATLQRLGQNGCQCATR